MELITGVGPKCFVLAHLANEIAPCKLIQDSLATLDSTLWIQDSTTRQQQQCIYLKKYNYKVYNTLCPANSYYSIPGRTRL